MTFGGRYQRDITRLWRRAESPRLLHRLLLSVRLLPRMAAHRKVVSRSALASVMICAVRPCLVLRLDDDDFVVVHRIPRQATFDAFFDSIGSFSNDNRVGFQQAINLPFSTMLHRLRRVNRWQKLRCVESTCSVTPT